MNAHTLAVLRVVPLSGCQLEFQFDLKECLRLYRDIDFDTNTNTRHTSAASIPQLPAAQAVTKHICPIWMFVVTGNWKKITSILPIILLALATNK